MQNKKFKNTILLRGMASNIVEEAIVVLKPNVKLKHKEFIDKNGIIQKNNLANNNILKEAENVIINYIETIEKENRINRKIKKLKKYRFLQITNIVLIVMLILTIIM
jgi:hypothetical protein